jgi:plasmid rolling circle replication initiator protein Rep
MDNLLLSRDASTTRKTLDNIAVTPSLDTVQQVDIADGQREREFRRASQSRSERWQLRTPNKREIVQRLHRLQHADADKLAKCCSVFHSITCGQHTVKSYPTYRCKKMFCPDCASERAARLSRQTEMKIGEVMKTTPGRLCFLTLTAKNSRTLETGLKDLKRSFAAFKRKKAFKAHIKGYVGGFEYTYNAKTNDFHVHLHLIVLRGKFWNQSDISDTWREVTGDSFIVDIREVKDVHKGVKELCKYIVKSTDLMKMPDEKFREVTEIRRGTRMFISGGCFYNVKFDDLDDADDGADVFNQFVDLKEGDDCPFCKEKLFDVLVSRDSAIGLYELNAMPGIVKSNSS